MYNLENQLMVNEVKGLLDGLDRYIRDVKYDLATDNISEMTKHTECIHKYVNKIEEKINKYNEQNQNDEDKIM